MFFHSKWISQCFVLARDYVVGFPVLHSKYIYIYIYIYRYIPHYKLGIYIYIYTKFIVWCEGKERSIPLQVERKQSKHTRQRSDVATLSFTPVGDLQATGSSNLLQAHINKGDI